MKKVWLIIFLISAVFLIVPPVSANWLLTGQGDLFYTPSNKAPGKPSPGQAAKPGQSNQTTSPGRKSSAPGRIKVKTHGSKALIENQGQSLTVQFLDQEGQELEEDQEPEETPEDEPSDQFTIEDNENGDTTIIRPNENASLVIRNKIITQTHFPLMVNLETNQLIVTTPKGRKIVTVLPDKAVENMLAANVLDQLGGKGGLKWLEYQGIATPSATPTATPSATPTATPSASATPSAQPIVSPAPAFQPAINLILADDGTLVYEIDGYKNEKLLGLFNIALKRLVIVSAETGDLVSIEQNLLTRILDFLSF